ncbi:hypothetical protein [Neisseria polysaccharea]|uniref:hypothetical protein n=1 Tax=Neisseria polysaccharea TaxID=489 RepID=UPI001864DF49
MTKSCGQQRNDEVSDGISCLPLKQFAAQLFKRVRYVSTHKTTHKAPPYVSS